MFILLIFSALIFHCLSLEGMWKAFIVCFAAQRIKKVKQFWQQVQLLRMKQLKLVNWYRKREQEEEKLGCKSALDHEIREFIFIYQKRRKNCTQKFLA